MASRTGRLRCEYRRLDTSPDANLATQAHDLSSPSRPTGFGGVYSATLDWLARPRVQEPRGARQVSAPRRVRLLLLNWRPNRRRRVRALALVLSALPPGLGSTPDHRTWYHQRPPTAFALANRFRMVRRGLFLGLGSVLAHGSSPYRSGSAPWAAGSVDLRGALPAVGITVEPGLESRPWSFLHASGVNLWCRGPPAAVFPAQVPAGERRAASGVPASHACSLRGDGLRAA